MAYLVDEDPTQSLLMSPGMAMAAQAAQNLTNMRMGGQISSPIDAYQKSVYERAQLNQQRKALEARQQLAQQTEQQKNPFYEYQQALAQGLVPKDTTFEQYQRIKNPQAKTEDARNLATYDELRRKAEESGLPEDADAAERFAYAANLVTENRASPALSSTDSARLSEANQAYQQARRQSNRLNNLAEQFQAADIDSGAEGAAEDWFKRFTGNEDFESELRREQREIINTDVINNLPPGVASDRDIQIAREGYPTNFANKDYVAAYFRGLAKLRALDADYERFVSNYITDEGNQRGMLRAWDSYASKKYEGWGGDSDPDTDNDPLGIR